MLASIAAMCLGGLLPLAFAPFEWWWIAPVLIACYARLCLVESPRLAFRRGFLFGAGAFLTGTYWLYHSVVTIGQVPLPLALLLVLGMVLIMAVYFGLNAFALAKLLDDDISAKLLLLPFIWVLTEWLRGWVLSGFPWLNLGAALPQTFLSGWLPFGGVHFGTLILVSIGSALAALSFGEQQRQRIAAGVLIAIAAASAIVYDRQWSEPLPDTISVSIGQLGQEQSLKWNPETFDATLEWYAQFALAGVEADLLLMPEVAIPSLAQRVEGYVAQIERLARQRGQTIALGILDAPEGQSPANALMTIDVDGRQIYEKRQLVPFGEFFPVPSFVRDWMKLKGLPYADIRRGDDLQSPARIAGHRAAVSICYEDAYSGQQLVFFPDANFIINVSNDAWFGDTIAPHQHLQIARARSAETRRWQARATNAGITALIDDRGRVVKTAPAFEPAILNGELRMRTGHTLYTRTGNTPLLCLCVILLIPGSYFLRRRRSGFNAAK